MLDDLIKHYQSNPDSLLARIYGVFTLKSQYFSSVDVIIMKSTAYMDVKSNPKMAFDIKGSTKNRCTKIPDKRFMFKSFNQDRILKDLNYLKINKELNNQLLQLSKNDHMLLQEVLASDSKFLMDQKIMDYSLLIVIEKLQESDPKCVINNASCLLNSQHQSQLRHTYN